MRSRCRGGSRPRPGSDRRSSRSNPESVLDYRRYPVDTGVDPHEEPRDRTPSRAQADATPNRTRLQIIESSRRRKLFAELINVSGQGALIRTRGLVFEDRTLWVRLAGPDQTVWVPAVPVHFRPGGAVGLEFSRRVDLGSLWRVEDLIDPSDPGEQETIFVES